MVQNDLRLENSSADRREWKSEEKAEDNRDEQDVGDGEKRGLTSRPAQVEQGKRASGVVDVGSARQYETAGFVKT